MGDFNEALINAKYHLAVAERMYSGYGEFPDKRFLIGVINEAARAASNLIKAFLIRANRGAAARGIPSKMGTSPSVPLKGKVPSSSGKDSKRNMKIFIEEIAPQYLDELTRENLFKVLEVEKAQKVSPIEYAKGDKIILLIQGKYRFLTAQRIGEFVESIKTGIGEF